MKQQTKVVEKMIAVRVGMRKGESITGSED
jgi:hypothetical protein